MISYVFYILFLLPKSFSNVSETPIIPIFSQMIFNKACNSIKHMNENVPVSDSSAARFITHALVAPTPSTPLSQQTSKERSLI